MVLSESIGDEKIEVPCVPIRESGATPQPGHAQGCLLKNSRLIRTAGLSFIIDGNLGAGNVTALYKMQAKTQASNEFMQPKRQDQRSGHGTSPVGRAPLRFSLSFLCLISKGQIPSPFPMV